MIPPIIIGRVYGTRTVIRELPQSEWRSRTRQWTCQCTCGESQPLTKVELLRNGRCKTCSNKGRANPESAYRRVAGWYRSNVKSHGQEWRLTDDEAKALFSAPCHYCGDPPSNKGRSKAGVHLAYSGIDRVDCLGAYVRDNCVPCCRTCNWAKGRKSYAEFTSWLGRVASFRSRMHQEAS